MQKDTDKETRIFDGRPLDPEEIRDLRMMKEEWKRFNAVISFLKWASGIMVAVYLARDVLARMFKAVFNIP